MKNWYYKIKRIRGELVILALLGVAVWYFEALEIAPVNFSVIVYKVILLSIAIIFVHISRQLVFPDMDEWLLLTDETPGLRGDTGRGLVIAGILIMFAILVYAFMSGI